MSVLMSDDFILDAEQYDEFKMWQGLIGPYYYPSVDDAGNLSWTNNGGLSNPATVNIQGRGLTIVGIVEDPSDLPETADDYVTYLVGDEPPYHGYIYDEGTWVDLGLIGKGDKGDKGDPGVGVPTGGTTGQVLKKASSTDYDTEWGVVEVLPTGGTTGQVLAKKTNTDYDTEWVNQSAGVDPATAAPLMDGTAAVGSSAKYAREDHVHPTDTSRQATLVSGTNIKTINNESILGSGDITITSGVSSVNGATGTVVLDADDVGASPEWELVWTNASPGSSFGGQKVELDLTGRTEAKIVFCEIDSGYVHPPYVGLFDLTESNGVMFSYRGYYESATTYLEGRRFTIASDGITFDNGTYEAFSNSGQSAIVNNGMVIPYKIFVR